MQHRARYLLHPVFLVGLITLIVNDHFLKDAYHNALTGKLSDFAGVLILPLFLKFVFGWRDRTVLAATVLFFTWLKSPFSQPLLDAYNAVSPLGFYRVVDASDLWAFLMLPLSGWVLHRLRTPRSIPVMNSRFARYLVFPMVLLSFMATSYDDDIYEEYDAYLECCEEPLETSFNDRPISVPSAFSPDGNGINDLLVIQLDTTSIRIDEWRIYNSGSGRDTLIVPDDPSMVVWDGTLDDTISFGNYFYELHLSDTQGTDTVFYRYFCSLPCPEGSTPDTVLAKNLCAWPSQLTPEGTFDLSIPSGEETGCY